MLIAGSCNNIFPCSQDKRWWQLFFQSLWICIFGIIVEKESWVWKVIAFNIYTHSVSYTHIFLSQLGTWDQSTVSLTNSIHCHVSCYFPWCNSHLLSFMPYYLTPCSFWPSLSPFLSGCHVRVVLQWLFLSNPIHI